MVQPQQNNEVKTVLYIVLGIIIIAIVVAIAIFVYKTFKTAVGLGADAVENNVVANSYGLTTQRVSELRSLATNVSMELGTNENSSWAQTYGNSDERKIINWCNQVRDNNEATAFKDIYQNTIVPGASLYIDLSNVLNGSELRELRYLSQFQ